MSEDVNNPSLGLQVAAWCYMAGWRGDDLRTAIAIAKAESGYRQDAKNVNTDKWSSTDWGIFQINDHYHTVTDSMKSSAPVNVRFAHVIWTSAGKTFKPWATYNSGAYKAHLTEADTLATLVEQTPSLQQGKFNENSGSASIDIPSVSNPLDALGAIPRVLARISSDIVMLLLILVLLILGILMVSGKLGKVASVTPVGKTASIAKKVLV